ncbi:MAG: hypothetical protein AB7G75_14695 [Candidatus Binatia bacterium]
MSSHRLAQFCFVLTVLWALHAFADEVELHVETVLASNSSQDFDDRLKALKPLLVSTFPYSSYRLVQEVRQQVSWGEKIRVSLPGERMMQVIPKAYEDHRIALQVLLREGTNPTSLLKASFLFPNNGTIFFAGRKHQDGILIIRIGATKKE